LGTVRCDVAFGGAFYAYVQTDDVGVRVEPGEFRRIIEIGAAVSRAAAAGVPIVHPQHADLGFLYGTIVTDAPREPGAHARNVCVFADGEVDRSPTGTGVSGRLAIEHARGRLASGEPFVVESPIGTRFTGRVLRTATVGAFPAIVPEVGGTAHITGRNELVLGPDDPLARGFILR
jgi:trans-L-3-hydroxyproline dehydratase